MPPRNIPPKPANPLRNRPSISAPTPLFRKATAGAAAARPPRRACPNKQCANPKVEEGICHNCGTIVDDSNIVAEVQFGESSSGAAVVQGSFLGADQGTAKSLGPAFRRAGGEEGREATVREGRQIMQRMGAQMPNPIPDHVINSGVQIFKIAAMNNFIQGRRMDMVASVCLYSACRKEKPCRVMLIDFADKCQVNVFKLGHTFKALHSTITISKDGILPVLPEDLIYRFATKLEFGSMLDKVAEDACRMVKRMSFDWMVMGRRPSGVCGACLILAARMNNFRRTITEVVYVVKVTTHTIQKRLDEFKLTSTSGLTIEEFLNNEWTHSAAHDPPSFYEKTEEFQKTKKRRKRRRNHDPDEDEDEEEHSDENSPNKRQKTATPNVGSPEPVLQLRLDADGFAIPPRPIQSDEIPIDPALVETAVEEQSGTTFNQLVQAFGDDPVPEDSGEEQRDETSETSSTPARRKRGPDNRPIRVSPGWANDEEQMEAEISEMISDPNTAHHAASYAQAAERAAAHMLIVQQNNPPMEVNMDVNIGEHEFDDDPEVANCLLTPEQIADKEKIWVNENKSWLRKQQVKEYQRLMALNGPPKATRNRKKKPRIGEGQTSAASSPGEAVSNLMTARGFSKKINYDAIKGLFDVSAGGNNALGSAATSRVTSRAGSVRSRDSSETPTDASETGASPLKDRNALHTPTATTVSPRIIEIDDEPDSDDDDYIAPLADASRPKPPVQRSVEEEEDWKGNINNSHKTGDDGDEGFDDDEDDYADDFENGDIEDTGFDNNSIDNGFGDDDD